VTTFDYIISNGFIGVKNKKFKVQFSQNLKFGLSSITFSMSDMEK